MSLYGALFAGVSGLTAQANAIGIISDNIANVNTVGFKAIETRFSSLVTSEASVTQHSPGGVLSNAFSFIDRQGLLQGSLSATDLAIIGDGFFPVREQSANAVGNDFRFTRAGSFTSDKNGDLVNAAGFYLQGYDLSVNPNPPPSASTLSNLTTVNISNLSGSATPTATIGLDLNLPSTAAAGDNFTVTTQVFDSLGNAHDFDIVFTKGAVVNNWTFAASDPTIAGVTTGTAAGAGSLVFNTDGTPATITIGTAFAVTAYTTGAANSAFTMDLGTVGTNDGLTQFASDFTIARITQDGVRFGTFTGMTIDEEGVVTAIFDNGQQRDIYQLPLASFPNPNALQAIDGNVFNQTGDSGTFLLNLVGNGGAGTIQPSALESSTVDLATEFTNMIVTQRAYSANARVITTTDQMLEELIRIR